jgi:hypothetical protein
MTERKRVNRQLYTEQKPSIINPNPYRATVIIIPHRIIIKFILTKQPPTCNLITPISLIIIANNLQSPQRAITHSYTVKILKNTQNPSITETSFGSYIMDGEKKNHTCGKMLKWRVGRASLPKT